MGFLCQNLRTLEILKFLDPVESLKSICDKSFNFSLLKRSSITGMSSISPELLLSEKDKQENVEILNTKKSLALNIRKVTTDTVDLFC